MIYVHVNNTVLVTEINARPGRGRVFAVNKEDLSCVQTKVHTKKIMDFYKKKINLTRFLVLINGYF